MASVVVESDEDYIMFGKHRGTRFQELPSEYLFWLSFYVPDSSLGRYVDHELLFLRRRFAHDTVFIEFARDHLGPIGAECNAGRIYVLGHHKDAVDRARKVLREKDLCLHCLTPLRPFRTSFDWDLRHLHKVCFFRLKEM